MSDAGAAGVVATSTNSYPSTSDPSSSAAPPTDPQPEPELNPLIPPFVPITTESTREDVFKQLFVISPDEIPEPPPNAAMIDLTPYYFVPMATAAKKLKIASSTLSKRWKEEARDRKWPSRTLRKLDKQIRALTQTVPEGQPLPADVVRELNRMLERRRQELRPIAIRSGKLPPDEVVS